MQVIATNAICRQRGLPRLRIYRTGALWMWSVYLSVHVFKNG